MSHQEAFNPNRRNHQFIDGFMPVLVAQAGMPLVQIAGVRQISEAHYDAHSNLERDVRAGMRGPDHAYAMAAMGGEPYGLWF